MKKFDIELAKAGAPVCTREGRPARIVCWDRKNDEYPVIALLGDFEYDIETYTVYGGKYKEFELEDDDDLMMAPTTHTVYVILYRSATGEIRVSQFVFDTREEAEKWRASITDAITIGEITWEE